MLIVHLCDLTANDARTYLVVGVDNKLLLQDLVDVFQQPRVLYEDNNKSVAVTGMNNYCHLFLCFLLSDNVHVGSIWLNFHTSFIRLHSVFNRCD